MKKIEEIEKILEVHKVELRRRYGIKELVSCLGYTVARNITYVFHNKSGMIEYEKIYRDTCQR